MNDERHQQALRTRAIVSGAGAFEMSESGHLSEHPFKLMRLHASDLMARNVVCVRRQLSLDALCMLFVETGLKAVPVVDGEGHVLGMVSETDTQLEIHTRAVGDSTRTVADVMVPLPFTVEEHTRVTEAAGLMVRESLERVPVVSAQGTVVGMLSTRDILYWLAKN
jgi:CBS domain-containing protein